MLFTTAKQTSYQKLHILIGREDAIDKNCNVTNASNLTVLEDTQKSILTTYSLTTYYLRIILDRDDHSRWSIDPDFGDSATIRICTHSTHSLKQVLSSKRKPFKVQHERPRGFAIVQH